MRTYCLRRIFRFVCLTIFGCVLYPTFGLPSAEAFGQGFLQESTSIVKETTPFLRHHVGMGLSFAGGTPTLGGNGAMLSALYGYAITPMIEAEFSVNYLGRTNASTVQSTRFANGWTGDMTFMFRLFDASDRFCIGFGPSLLWQGFTGGSGFSTDPNGAAMRNPLQTFESMSLGGNLKLEYLFPLSQKMDLGFRGQVHLALEPFSGTSYVPNSVSGSAGIGIFLRGGW